MRPAVLALVLLACGPGRQKFVPEYADIYCSFLLECGDPAELTFDGILSMDDCLVVVGPAVEQQMATCKYHTGKAKDCLNELEVASCPAEDEAFDDAVPAVCDEVWTQCAAPAADDNNSTLEDTDA